MSIEEYRLVAGGWFLLILFLTVFWYATLRRLEGVFKEHLDATRSHQSIGGLTGMLQFIIRGDFRRTGDERMVGVCQRLRKLLYGYLGSVAAFIVFLVICRPHY
jgi:hypothetical protein